MVERKINVSLICSFLFVLICIILTPKVFFSNQQVKVEEKSLEKFIFTQKQINVDKSDIYYSVTTYLNSSKHSWNEENLKEFSSLLKKSMNNKGFIIIYAGKISRINEANNWIEKLKKYIKNNLKADLSQITFIDGGFRENAIGELFIIPKSEITSPIPTPTLSSDQAKIISKKKMKSKKLIRKKQMR